MPALFRRLFARLAHGSASPLRPPVAPASAGVPNPSEASAERGFVFAATGEKYNILAHRAAHSLRRVMPDVAVDLFSDQPMATLS